jgi:hypothetical protein
MIAQRRNLTVFGAAALVGLLAYGSVFLPLTSILSWLFIPGPYYSVWDPQSATWKFHRLVTPATFGYPSVAAVLFWLSCSSLRRGRPEQTTGTLWFAGFGALASCLYYALSWRSGQGRAVMAYALIAAAGLVPTVVGLRAAARAGSWWGRLAAQWCLFGWLMTFAFPAPWFLGIPE